MCMYVYAHTRGTKAEPKADAGLQLKEYAEIIRVLLVKAQ